VNNLLITFYVEFYRIKIKKYENNVHHVHQVHQTSNIKGYSSELINESVYACTPSSSQVHLHTSCLPRHDELGVLGELQNQEKTKYLKNTRNLVSFLSKD